MILAVYPSPMTVFWTLFLHSQPSVSRFAATRFFPTGSWASGSGGGHLKQVEWGLCGASACRNSAILCFFYPRPWMLRPLSNSWIILIIWLYIAVNRTPIIDCYLVGAVPNLGPKL